jgi:hypothetical protein
LEYFSDAIAFSKRFVLPIDADATVDNTINEVIKKSPNLHADLCIFVN